MKKWQKARSPLASLFGIKGKISQEITLVFHQKIVNISFFVVNRNMTIIFLKILKKMYNLDKDFYNSIR